MASTNIPETFFQLQETLLRGAARIADASGTGDQLKLNAAFRDLMDTCIVCHAYYVGSPQR